MARATGNADEVFRALADPTRRTLLDRLYAESGLTSGELGQRLAMTRQAVAQHLAVLEAANLVLCERRGREKRHYLNPVPIHEIYERWVRKFEKRRLGALLELRDHLEGRKHG